jgi:hypothetical protein
LQERIKFCFCEAGALSFVGTFECKTERAKVVTKITLRLMEFGDWLSSGKIVTEKPKPRLDEKVIKTA